MSEYEIYEDIKELVSRGSISLHFIVSNRREVSRVLACFVFLSSHSPTWALIFFFTYFSIFLGLVPELLIHFFKMLVLEAITLLAGLSTVSAVPMAQPRRRGFTLNQLIKPTTKGLARTANLPGIYAGVYTKFGASVPADLKSAADNGTAVAKPEEDDKEYLTPVKIGDTTLNLDIDTGSADL